MNLLGVSDYCGIDCERMTLFVLGGKKWSFEIFEEIELGVM